MYTKIKSFRDTTERNNWLIRECIASAGFCVTNIKWQQFSNNHMSGLISEELLHIIIKKQLYPFFSPYLIDISETNLLIVQNHINPDTFRFAVHQKLNKDKSIKEFNILIRGKYETVKITNKEIIFS
jgi:hypothetical protein